MPGDKAEAPRDWLELSERVLKEAEIIPQPAVVVEPLDGPVAAISTNPAAMGSSPPDSPPADSGPSEGN